MKIADNMGNDMFSYIMAEKGCYWLFFIPNSEDVSVMDYRFLQGMLV